jgi:hypothetical protein
MGIFDTMFGGAAEKEAADKNRALYGDYQNKGSGYLSTGYTNSKGYLNDALGAYQPLADLAKKYTGGTDMYLDALGLNGATGTQEAKSAYTTGPGYDWQLGQGLDAINRRRAAGGMLDSGNADIDALTYGQGLAKQDYGGWLDRLSGINNNAISTTSGAAAGQAGAYGSLSDLETGNATNQVGLLGNTTSGMASANNTEAATISRSATSRRSRDSSRCILQRSSPMARSTSPRSASTSSGCASSPRQSRPIRR